MKNNTPLFLVLALCVFFLSCYCPYRPYIDDKIIGCSTWDSKIDTSWYNTSQSEFTITTAEAFAGLAVLVNNGNNFMGKTIKLEANITLNNTINWQNWAISVPNNVWTSIGTSAKPFSGTFDGGGFIISGVYINSANDDLGLFGYVSSKGTIKNIGVTASYIKGKVQVGGLVGYNNGSVINSYFSGAVIGVEKVGGLVGSNTSGGTISFSYSTVTVTGERYIGGLVGYNASSLLSSGGIQSTLTSSIVSSYSVSVVIGISNDIGGLVGGNWGIIISSYFSGTVTGLENVGGLVGDNNGGSMIDSSYSIGTIKGNKNVGGLIGFNGGGKINVSYSEMTVTGMENIGGFVGQNSNDGIINNSYSIGYVIGERYVGGFTGWNLGTISYSYSTSIVSGVSSVGGFAGKIDGGKIISCYYNKETSRQNDTGKGDGKTTAEMKLEATFVGWDFVKIWNISITINNGYIHLRTFYPSIDGCSRSSIWNGMADTAWYVNNKDTSEFTICTAEQLAGLAVLVNNGNNFMGKTIKLGANIMLNDTTGWKNWASNAPANKWTKIGTNIKQFNGTFDGKNFVINGVYINSTNNEQGIGLFGFVNSKGIIKDIGVTASYIKAEDNQVGGLAGVIKNIVSNSYFIGTVIGKSGVGGLIGSNHGVISNSYSDGTVTGESLIGGLIGDNTKIESYNVDGSNISNSYSMAFVTGGNEVGGFTGRNIGLINNSYSTGGVNGKAEVGGFIGSNYDYGSINNSYSSSKVTGESNVGGFIGSNSIGKNIGTISSSYSIGTVEGKRLVGGFAGSNQSVISNSYSTGAITGTEYSVGGFVGQNEGSVSNSYSVGATTTKTKDRIGAFVGWQTSNGGAISDPTISACYYNKETNGQSNSVGRNDGKGVAEGKTTMEIKKKETFADWDFAEIWDMNSTTNSGYPYLRENQPK